MLMLNDISNVSQNIHVERPKSEEQFSTKGF
jgi:hypothetical protein